MSSPARVIKSLFWVSFACCAACGSASAPITVDDSPGSGVPGETATGGTNATGGNAATGGTAAQITESTEITETLLVDDADDGDDVNTLSGKWISYDDRQEGGSSKVNPPSWIEGVPLTMDQPGYGASPYAVHLSGTTGSSLGYDYVGLVMALGEHSYCPDPEPPATALAHYRGVRFQAKANRKNGGSFSLIIAHRKDGSADNCSNGIIGNTLTGWADYQLDLTSSISEDWSLVTVYFRRDLAQPNFGIVVSVEEVLSHAKDLVWQYQNGAGGEADLWIDNVELFK